MEDTEEECDIFDYKHSFASLMLHPRHRKLSHEVYKRLPERAKKN